MDDHQVERLILVAEGNPEHAQLIEKAFLESSIRLKLITLHDGGEVMDFLLKKGEDTGAGLPDLILLDLDLPGRDGREVLAEIKSSLILKRIPIVILAFSSKSEDVLSSYQLQGNCYIVKSSDVQQLFSIVKRIEEFWLDIVTLPTV